MMTYGDMMSLLLAFFILLVAMSELKREELWRAILDEVHRAFGKQASGAKNPTKVIPTSVPKQVSMVQMNQQRHRRLADVDDPAIRGRHRQVTQIREADRFVVGGPITFEAGSSDLTNEAKQQLIEVANRVRGHNNKIELRGHAGSLEVAGLSAYEDLWDLSLARAKAAMSFLTGHQGIRPERIRLIANGQHEPLRQRGLSMRAQGPNRRVEVVVSDALLEEFGKPQGANSE